MRKTLLLLVLVISAINVRATIVFVDSTNFIGFQDGTSWATAFSSFQAGINAANSGDSVWVAKGTYQPSLGSSFAMKEGVKIFGGFLNNHSTFNQRNFQDNHTILKGNNATVITNSPSLNLSNAAILDGFIITRGKGQLGGGMYNETCSPTIINCIFSANVSVGTSSSFSGGGGGMFNKNGANPLIDNCTFVSDTAKNPGDGYGGAICNLNSSPIISNSTFSFNVCTNSSASQWGLSNCSGGAIYGGSPIINNCVFNDNYVYISTGNGSAYGGAIAGVGSSSQIINCSFTNNKTRGTGYNSVSGPIYGYGYGSAIQTNGSALISGCFFSNNYSPTSSYGRSMGGAISSGGDSVKIENCIFENNKATEGGGHIYFSIGLNRTTTISNCTFSGGKAKFGGAIHGVVSGGRSKIENCHFYSDTAIYGGAIYYNSNSNFSVKTKNLVVNSLFYENVADSFGAAIYNKYDTSAFVNCTIIKNITTLANGGAIYNESCNPYLTNVIVKDNSSGIVNDGLSAPKVTYSLVQGYPASTVNHNIAGTTDPLFVNAITNDYSLQSGSPVIDLGNNDSIPAGVTTDLAGNARIYGSKVDMGAYEYVVLPPLVILGNDTTICAGSTLTLDADNPGSTYSWSTGATTQTINVAAAGTYSVTVTNSAGSATDTIIVSIAAVPIVHLGVDTAICAGDNLTIDAGNSGSTYLWNTGATTQSISVNTTGNYSVTVTNAAGCSASDTMQVTFNALPVVNLGNDTSFCAGNTLTLNAGNVGNTYLWNTGATTQTIAVNTSGIYSVTVTNAAGCSASDSVQLISNALPEVNLGNDTTFCADNTITLDVGNTGSTYLWNTGVTTQSITVNSSGNYSVIVTNAAGCVATDSKQVIVNPLPVVDLGSDTIICEGNSLILNAGNAGSTYLWNTGATTQSITVDASDNYSVTVTDAAGCSASNSIQVISNALPVVNLGNDTTFCADNTITLDAGNTGSTYLWSTGAITQSISVNSSGNYSIIVTNAAGCAATDNIQVIVNPIPVVDLGSDTAICAGNSLILNAGNAGSTYLWSTGATTQSITVDASDNYSVTVTDAVGCSATDSKDVIFLNPPIVDLGPDITTSNSSYLLDAGNAGSTYLWNTGATTQTITVNTSGVYSVVVSNAPGCSDADTITVTFTGTGLSDVSANDRISISPNPTKNDVTIYNIKDLNTNAYIIDVYGRVLAIVQIKHKNQTISLQEFPSGAYVIRLENGAFFKVIKD